MGISIMSGKILILKISLKEKIKFYFMFITFQPGSFLDTFAAFLGLHIQV